jgi:riboflavin biosynthesis pyrimidine reductase
MRQLIPATGSAGIDVGPGELAGLYAYPRLPWLRANMVASADGAATFRGRSGGLSGEADRQVFALLRSLADVVIVGAQTARAEQYRPAKPENIRAELRAGRPATPPIAVISRRLDLDLQAPLFTAAPPQARTIVITTGLAPHDRRAELDKHADVIVAGAESVDFSAALAALAARGHRRMLTEGGPHLLGQLISAGLLDELCLTVSPLLTGPGAGRIVTGPGPGGAPAALPESAGPEEHVPGRPLELAHVLEADGFLLCRYIARAEER